MTRLFGHTVRSDLLLLCLADALLCFLAVSLQLVWQGGAPAGQGGTLAIAVAVAGGCIAGATGLYRPEALGRMHRLLKGIVVATLLLLTMLPLLAWLSPAAGADLRAHLPGVTLAFTGAVVLTRLGFNAAQRGGLLRRGLAVVRTPDRAVDLVRLTGALVRGDHVARVLDLAPGCPVDQVIDPARLRAAKIRTVILPDALTVPPGLRHACTAADIEVVGEAEFLEHQLARVDIERLPANWLLRANAMREGPVKAALLRGTDILLGILLVLLTLPVLPLTALAIKLDSKGPVFYRQERVGLGGRVFMLFKFRSMVVDAEIAGAPVWASKGDARVTRVGRFIRLTRIDELPQVLNVLRGDMAFVGPRPERPGFVETLAGCIPHYRDRAVVKPGITGWAQVNFPYGASVEDARMKLAYDLYYVRRRSMFLNLLILIATIRVVLFQEGSR